MKKDLSLVRDEYTRAGLTEADADENPIVQFNRWFDDAVAADLLHPNAMTLATVDEGGRPSARVVLLKGVDERGFVFFTNYDSRKGRELAANPIAALVFYWAALERQVRVDGTVAMVTDEESDEYFATRPYGSQIGAWASEQSAVIASREVLEARARELEARYADGNVPRPARWGGYRVAPVAIEFWQGRPNRLHDRLRYRLEGGAWTRDRLSP
jgi:pyridoxamine 5'-phosphate oxidase